MNEAVEPQGRHRGTASAHFRHFHNAMIVLDEGTNANFWRNQIGVIMPRQILW